MKRKIIPHERYLKVYARKLRHNMTYSEIRLWNQIKNGGVLGYDFDRQKAIGQYIVDFYCKDLQLALEVDGASHLDEKAIEKDLIMQRELEAAGVSFIRFDALLIINEVEAAISEIIRWIVDYEQKHGPSEFAKRKRIQLANPGSRKR